MNGEIYLPTYQISWDQEWGERESEADQVATVAQL